MAKAAAGMKLEGLDELHVTLKDFAPNEARNLLRATVHGVAGEVRDRLRRRAPKKSGTLSKAFRADRLKSDRDNPQSAVNVTHGKGEKYDAFYWHMVEHGTVNADASPFIGPTVEEMRPDLPGVYRQEFGEKYEKALAKRAKKGGK